MRVPIRSLLGCASVLIGVLLGNAVAHARTPTVAPPERRPLLEDADPELRAPFSDRFGVDAAKAPLGVDDERAIQRLARLDSEPALQELVRLAEAPGSLSDRSLLLLTRALARPSAEPSRVRALYAILARSASDPSTWRQTPLGRLARQQAAVGLSLSGSSHAQVLLSRMVKRGHEDGALAKRALLAHPPADLHPLLDSPGAPNVLFVELLEELGDQRAFAALRGMVRKGSPEVQARAAVALTRLGHFETVELAEHWLKTAPRAPFSAAATEILLQAGAERAPSAWRKLYDEEPERAVELALRHPQPRLAEAVEDLLGDDFDPRLASILGHSGGAKALSLLEQALGTRQASTVAYALSRCPDKGATAVLERALSSDDPETLRLVVLAAVVRERAFGESVSGLSGMLLQLRKSKRRDDVFVGVFGQSVLRESYAVAQLRSPSDLVVSASVASALVQGPAFFRAAAEQLQKAPDSARRELLGVALLDDAGRDRVPSHLLEAFIHRGSSYTTLARLALSERNDARFAPRVQDWLESPDALTRASTALGLARHDEPSFTGKLSTAYHFEAEADVRLALVFALSRRAASPPRREALELAASLDPDARVRAAAALALAGQKLQLLSEGSEIAWLEIPDGPVPDSLVLVLAPGFSVVVPTSGQRVLPILGAPSASLSVRLAPGGDRGNDAEPGVAGPTKEAREQEEDGKEGRGREAP